MAEENNEEINSLSDSDITTFKTAACAINLGANIIKHMIGDSISKAPDVDIIELVSAALNSELML